MSPSVPSGSNCFRRRRARRRRGCAWSFVTLGGSLGLLLESLLYGVVASHWVAIGALALLAFPGAFLVARYFPETAGRTLEDIAPERA